MVYLVLIDADLLLIWMDKLENCFVAGVMVMKLKVVVRACYGAYFVAHVLNIWLQILFPGDLHDSAL